MDGHVRGDADAGLTGHDGGVVRNEDVRAWELLAAAAEEGLSLELSAEAFDALARVERVYRAAAGLPSRSRRRLRLVSARE